MAPLKKGFRFCNELDVFDAYVRDYYVFSFFQNIIRANGSVLFELLCYIHFLPDKAIKPLRRNVREYKNKT